MENNVKNDVSVNKFVRRQIYGSGKTYAVGLSFDEIATHAEDQLAIGSYRRGYREGVLLVQVEKSKTHHFISPFVKLTKHTKLIANLVNRRDGEAPYIQLRALNGTILKASSVDLILYHHNVLAETNEQNTNSEWELISFHAIPEGIVKMPMGPVTMMRNQMQLKGGTKGHYSSEEWAESVKFWQEYAVLDENFS